MSHKDVQTQQISFLRRVDLFKDLGDDDLLRLAGDFKLKKYKKGEVIFHQGASSQDLYIIKKGKIRIFRTSLAGNETSIQIFSTHQVIGEFAMIDGQPRSATAKSIDYCQLLVMSRAQFLNYLAELPGLALALCRLLTDKVRWTAAYAEAVAQFDAAGRLLHILLIYKAQFGEPDGDGNRWVLDLGLNQSDLASLVGVRREWVSRLLQGWKKRGLIEHRQGKIVFIDLDRVQEEHDSRIEAHFAKW